jgi:hypothetical protein
VTGTGPAQRAVTLLVREAPERLGVEHWAEAVFVASNAPGPVAGEDPVDAAVRAAMHDATRLRSLSVGDTVTVEGETVACTSLGWQKIAPAGTWTFMGHWEGDRITVTDIKEGEVDDDRKDTGRHEQGLWAASASGPSVEVAAHIAAAEYENDH